jgi:hypothetical protein
MIERWIGWYAELLNKTSMSESLVILIENATIIPVSYTHLTLPTTPYV